MDFFVENREFSDFNHVVSNVRFTVLEHGYLKTGTEWSFQKICSPFNRLYLSISGDGAVWNDTHRLELKPEHMVLIPLNTTYDYACYNQLEKFYVHFRIEMIPGHDLFEPCRIALQLPVIKDLAQNLTKLASAGGVSDLIFCKSVLLECISRFLAPYQNQIAEQVQVTSEYSELYSYILEHCYADLRVNEIAEHFHMRMENLSKNFKNDTGMTLKKFIEGKLLQKAQEQLLVTNHPVKEIAQDLRFSDEFHFSRFFKKHTGMPPNFYRKRNNVHK